jgi:serine/threonine protein phosphatase 1
MDRLLEARNDKHDRRGFLARLTGRARPAVARVPDGVRVYAVGDIHGCAFQLDRLLTAIQADAASHTGAVHLVFLGDYVDRGPDSKGVIERLLALPSSFSPRFLRGNHDQAILDFLRDPAFYRAWRNFGAAETLVSYGVKPPLFDRAEDFAAARDQFAKALPHRHLRFFETLELHFQIGDYFFAHAGVRPGIALEQQTAEDLLWIRDEFLMSKNDFGAVVVHGHTPGDSPVRRSNRICVDTGAYATGRLTAAALHGEHCDFLAT